MNTLYIRLPSMSDTGHAQHWLDFPYSFALVSDAGVIEREGVALLSTLSETIAKMQHLVLLLSGSNVTVLQVKVPPLSAARMKAALPSLVEDQLLCDSTECVIVAGGLSDGLRTVAVVQRAWLDLLSKTFIAFGGHHITALPAQLCMSHQSAQLDQPGSVTASITELDADIDMTLCLSEQDGIGLSIGPVPSQVDGVGQNEFAASMAIQTLCAVVPEAPVTLYVPQSAVLAYQDAANDINALNKHINVLADNWSRWIDGARATQLDLMAGLGARVGSELNWRPWRWTLMLAVAVLLINAAILNIDWWHMKGEARALRATMTQIYKSAYPKESVIIDPVAQMQQKIMAAKRNSGLAEPDDFTALTAAFGEEWVGIEPMADKLMLEIAALEYRERSLFVRFKPVLSRVEWPVLSKAEGAEGETPMQLMKVALAKHNLSLELAPDQEGAVVWKIRSAR